MFVLSITTLPTWPSWRCTRGKVDGVGFKFCRRLGFILTMRTKCPLINGPVVIAERRRSVGWNAFCLTRQWSCKRQHSVHSATWQESGILGPTPTSWTPAAMWEGLSATCMHIKMWESRLENSMRNEDCVSGNINSKKKEERNYKYQFKVLAGI